MVWFHLSLMNKILYLRIGQRFVKLAIVSFFPFLHCLINIYSWVWPLSILLYHWCLSLTIDLSFRRSFIFYFPVNGVSFIFEYTILSQDASNFTCFFPNSWLRKRHCFGLVWFGLCCFILPRVESSYCELIDTFSWQFPIIYSGKPTLAGIKNLV